MKMTRQNSEWLVATVVAVLAITLGAFGVWVFHSPAVRGRSLTDTVLSDRITLGLVRLLVAVTALYALASIAVLVTRGRWLRSFSATGVEVDPSDTDSTISELRSRLARVTSERDAYRLLAGRSDG